MRPVSGGMVTSPFGYRTSGFHKGVDISYIYRNTDLCICRRNSNIFKDGILQDMEI